MINLGELSAEAIKKAKKILADSWTQPGADFCGMFADPLGKARIPKLLRRRPSAAHPLLPIRRFGRARTIRYCFVMAMAPSTGAP